MSNKIEEMFQEESGDLSFARVGLAIMLAFTVLVCAVDLYLVIGTALSVRVPNPVYAILTAIDGGFMMWAAGKGIAANMTGVFGAIGQAISNATREKSVSGRRELGKDFDAEVS